MKTSNIFTEHPKAVRMSYLQHARFALMLSATTLTCAIGSFIHAFFPFLFVTHTSTTIRKLQDLFDQREKELPVPESKIHREDAKTQRKNNNAQCFAP
jgi:hypothetical protein